MWNFDFFVQFWDAISQLKSRKHREPRNPRPQIPRAQKILVYFIYYVINGLQKVFNSKFLVETRSTENTLGHKRIIQQLLKQHFHFILSIEMREKGCEQNTNVIELDF